MATIFARKAYDMTKYNFYALETATELVPHLNKSYTVNGVSYPDRIAAVYKNGTGSLVFASKNIPEDDTFVTAKINGLFHSSPASGVWAGIQGVSVSLKQIDTVWNTPGTVDDQAMLGRMLAGADTFKLSEAGDLAKGFGGNDMMSGNGGADRLYGGEGADTVRGASGNDKLYGEHGNDKLHAGSGQDSLIGGGGKDWLYGGTDGGADVFVFNDWLDSMLGSAARDVIGNFTRGADNVDLRGVDADEGSEATNESFGWSGRTAEAHSVWWRATDGGVLLRADVSGDTLAEIEIFVKGVSALSSEDVLL